MIFLWDLGGCWVSFPCLSSALLPFADVSLEGAYTHVWSPRFCGWHPEDIPHDRLVLVASRAYVLRPHRTIANKNTVLNWISPQGSVQREWTETPSFQPFRERGVLAYFKSYCLSIWFPINLHLDAGWNPLLWYTDRFVRSLNYWEPLRTKKSTWTISKVWESTQELGLSWKIRFLSHRNLSSKMEKVAVLYNAPNPTQGVKKNKEIEKYIPNKRMR